MRTFLWRYVQIPAWADTLLVTNRGFLRPKEQASRGRSPRFSFCSQSPFITGTYRLLCPAIQKRVIMKRKLLLMRNHNRGSDLPRIAAFLLTALLSCISTMTFADDFFAVNDEGVTIYYNYINNNTEAEVTYKNYGSYSGTVNIPKTVEQNGQTLNVTSIGEYAFYNCSSLTSITIPNSVTSIGNSAFQGCSSLTSITIPNSVTGIADHVFKNCSNLTSVTIGKSVTSIGMYAFEECNSLAEVVLQGNTLPTCGTNVFYKKSGGYSNSNATLYCNSTLAEECRKTEPWSNFDSIYPFITLASGERLSKYITDDIKYTVTKLKIFGEINNTDIKLIRDMAGASDSEYQTSGQLVDLDLTDANIINGGESYFHNTSYNFTTTNNAIGSFMFYCCKLKNVKLPKSVTTIGDNAFSYCTDLVSVDIPENVTTIGGGAFLYCLNLTSITIPNSVTSIGSGAFWACPVLTSVNIPDCITVINGLTFLDCKKLTSITIPDGVTSIGESAFSGCSNLTSITIPDKVTSIGEKAFYDCSNLTSITIPDGVTSIGKYAFYNCSNLTSITIGKSVTSIDWSAFSGCSNLSEVTLQGTSLPECKANAFDEISSDATLYCYSTLAEKCRETEPWNNFKKIDASVVTLASGERLSNYITDENKYTVTKLKIFGEINNTDIKLIRDMAGASDDEYQTAGQLVDLDLTDANIIEGGEVYFHNEYQSFTTTNNAIGSFMFYNCKLKNVKLPKSVTTIGNNAFHYCTDLVSVDIPKNVTTIGSEAFRFCSNLTSITIPDGVTSISGYAFYNCSNLTSINIPDGVTSIGGYAFHNCSNLTSITIPDGVTSISEYAFSRCSSLTSIDIPNSVTSIDQGAFAGSGLTSVTIPNSVTSIDQSAFYTCGSLTSVTIGEKVPSIGDFAFSYCRSLTSIDIPNSVTSIGDFAFGECSGLTSVTIPNSVTSIGESAFKDCSSLTEVTLQGTALPTCGAEPFNNISSDATLYCKAALIETCKTTAPWSSFSKIVAIPFSIIISDAGIATACSDKDLDFSEVADVKAYIASGFSPSEGKVLLTRAMKIPAKTGFIVKGNAGTYKIPVAATDYTYANLLVGTLAETTVAETDGDYTNYVLANDATAGVGFYKANNTAVSANKAYLHIPTSAVATDGTSEAKASLRLDFDDEDGATGMNPVTNGEEEINGNAVIYNLNGQRMQGLTKGLNIVDGKKIFVK